MMSNKIKKMLAVVLAMVMVLGMSITSYAATGEETGSQSGTGAGTFEGSVDKDVISVTLPTSTENTFKYILDPEGLIAATANAKYTDATFEEGANVFFQSADNTYTKESAKLKVINKGTVDVDITVEASVGTTGAIDYDSATMDDKDLSEIANTVSENVIMSKDASVSANDLPILYLGLQVADQDAVAVRTVDDETTPAEVAVGVRGNEDNYSVSYNSIQQKYEFSINGSPEDTAWNSMEFNLIGECNTNGNWSATGLAAPTVSLTWSYAVRQDGSDAPLLEENKMTEAAPTFTSTVANVISFTDGAGDLALADEDAITKIEGQWGEYYDKTSKVTIDYSAKTITAESGAFGTGEAVPVRITYTNVKGETCTATVSLVVPAN